MAEITKNKLDCYEMRKNAKKKCSQRECQRIFHIDVGNETKHQIFQGKNNRESGMCGITEFKA